MTIECKDFTAASLDSAVSEMNGWLRQNYHRQVISVESIVQGPPASDSCVNGRKEVVALRVWVDV